MILYGTAQVLFGTYMRLALGFTASGRALVPTSGPLIVCANHTHWLDPLVIAHASPRRIYFMAKQELFANPVMAAALRGVGAFPVRRGEIDRAALRRTLDLLRDAQAVGIFPEGTRSRDGKLSPGEPGAAAMSMMTGATVIPAGIDGFRPGARLRITWGEPISPAKYGGATARRDRAAVQAFTDDIMDSIARLSGRQRAGGGER